MKLEGYSAYSIAKLLIKAKTVGEKADLFSGLLFCKNCNAQMTKKVDKQRKPYTYYICSAYNKCKGCSGHYLEQEELSKAVLEMIHLYLHSLGKYEKIANEIRQMEISYDLLKK